MNRSAPDPPQESNPAGRLEVREVRITPAGLPGTLRIPHEARSVVLFAHGSGSSRFSPRNMAVAEALNERGFATLLFDLLSAAEETKRANVFDIPLLAGRLAGAVEWLGRDPWAGQKPIGLFGASACAPSFRAAAAPISQTAHSIKSAPRRSLLWAAPTMG